MKKFKSLKLMLLGVLAMGSMNAFAQELATTVWRYSLDSKKNATINGFVADYTDRATVVIPNKVADPANSKTQYTVTAINEDAFKSDKGTITSVTIEAGSLENLQDGVFSGCGKLTSINFAKATGLKNIEPGAFAGTKIEALDLSNTKVETVNNWFSTNAAYTSEATYYDAKGAYNENVKRLGDKAITEKTPKTTHLATQEDCDKENAKNPAALKAGDDLLYTKASANKFNYATFGPGTTTNLPLVKAGQKIYWTTASATLANQSLPGALVPDEPLTLTEARAYNKWVDVTLSLTEKQTAVKIYNEQLPGALHAGTPAETFVSHYNAYDFNRALWGQVDKKGYPVNEGFKFAEQFSPEEAAEYNEKNAAAITAGTLTAVVEGETKPAKMTKFQSDDEAEEYNTAHGTTYAMGDYYPWIESSIQMANTVNKSNFKGCVIYSDKKVYDESVPAEINAKNLWNAGLEGAYDYTTATEVQRFVEEVIWKKEGETLSDADTYKYNATLTGAVQAGQIVDLDEDGEQDVYDEDDAYAANELIAFEKGVAYLAKEGNKTGLKATEETAAEYNRQQEWSVEPGSFEVVDKYYTWAEADELNVTALGTDSKGYPKYVKAGDKKTEAGVQKAVTNATLASVKLPKTWKAIAANPIPANDSYSAGAFEGCTALASIDFGGNNGQDQVIQKQAFLATSVKKFDFSATQVAAIPSTIIVDQDQVKKNTTLEEVKMNTHINQIKDYTFNNCTALATVAFPDNEAYEKDGEVFGMYYDDSYAVQEWIAMPYAIGDHAFANTAIASFTLPESTPCEMDDLDTDADDIQDITPVQENAFLGCTKLKEFTYLPESLFPEEVVDYMAFPGCKGVKFTTVNSYIKNNPDAPKNSYYSLYYAGYQTEFKPVPFKNNPNKYYIKYIATETIAVPTGNGTKVYNAYLDEVDETLNMNLYKVKAGNYIIGAGETVLIITNDPDLNFTVDEKGYGTTDPLAYPVDLYSLGWENAMKIAEKDIERAELDAESPTTVPYGWVSTENGTGWQMITTGKYFPAGSMYILAAETEATKAGRLTVKWLDENGNVEAETTGIKSILGEEAADSDAIFNLQGVRVNGAQKGIFIQNGKKYVK